MSIPKTIRYTICKGVEIKTSFNKTGSAHVRPAFAQNAEAKSNTALRWAGTNLAHTLEVPNNPITTLELYDIERRSEGGRAWKVGIPLKKGAARLLVDLREDVLLDVILMGKAAKGILQGPFIWAINGSQMRLVRVGSTLHKSIELAEKRQAAKPIPPAAWVFGGVYADKNGREFVYLGPVDTDVIERTYVRGGPDTFKHVPRRKVPAWMPLEGVRGVDSLTNRWVQTLTYHHGMPTASLQMGSMKVIEHTGTYSWKPEQAYAVIRKAAMKYITYRKQKLKEHSVRPAEHGFDDLGYFSHAAHIRAPGSPRPEHKKYKGFFEDPRFTKG